MTEYRLPPGMTADVLRDLADDPVADKVHAALHAWADAIDPPEPASVVTDEMIDAVADEVGWVGWGDVEQVLRAVGRLGWLRDPDARSPSGNDEPWPTDEQVEAAARVIAGEVTEWDDLHPDNRESLRVRARDALEAVAPPPTDTLHRALMSELRDRGADPDLTWDEAIGIMAERLEMAEGLLRLIVTDVWISNFETAGEAYGCTPAEAEYLRSLTGEGDSDE